MIIRRQKSVKGGRIALPSCVITDINTAVEQTSRKFHVSKSFVIAVALADYFGIDEQEQFIQSETKHWKKPLRIVRK